MIFTFVGGKLDGERRTVKPPNDFILVDGATYRRRSIPRNTHSGQVVVEFYADESLSGLDAVEMLVKGYRMVDDGQ